MRRDVCAAVLVALGAGACSPDVSVGEERRLTVVTARQRSDGRWRQAGFRVAGSPSDATSQLWFGTTEPDGGLPRFGSTLPAEGSALTVSTELDGRWVVGGTALGEDGKPSAFVAMLEDDDAVAWSARLMKPAGSASKVTGLTRTLDGQLLVVGLDVDGASSRGWAVKLDARGQELWRRHFETDFQRTARGFVPLAVAAPKPGTGASHVQVYLTGTRELQGVARPYALMMTLGGELWDSTTLGDAGVPVGVVMDELTPVFCVQDDGAVRALWPRVGDFDSHDVAAVPLGAEGGSLLGCARTTSAVVLAGVSREGGLAHAFFAEAPLGTRSFTTLRRWDDVGPVTLFGVVQDAAGAPVVVGRSEPKARRFWAGLERFGRTLSVR